MGKKNRVILFFLLLFCAHTQAQDSTMLAVKKVKIHAFRISDADFDSLYLQPLDTSLRSHQLYSQIQKNYQDHAFLGVAGSPSRPFAPVPTFEFWNNGLHQYDVYRIKPDEQLFFRVNTPYTRVRYLTGSMVEQNFELLHTQNLGKAVNIGVLYHNVSSDGLYSHQQAYSRNTTLFGNYSAFKSRLTGFVSFVYNSHFNQDNGGIVRNSLFNTVSALPRIAEAVKLSSAESRTRNRYFLISHNYSVRADSNSSPLILYHRFLYNQDNFAFQDAFAGKAGFSQGIFRDSSRTRDSVAFYNIQNEFGVRSLYSARFPWSISFELRQNYHYTLFDLFSQNQGIVRTSLGFLIGKKLVSTNSLQLDVLGSGLGEIKSAWQFHSGTWKINFELTTARQAVSRLFCLMKGNGYQWTNFFDPIQKTSISARLARKNLNLWVQGHAIGNYVWLQADSTPAQFTGNLQILQLGLAYDFNWRWLHYHLGLNFQKSNQTDILHMPDLYTVQSLYAEFGFKRTGLRLQFGTDFFYQSAWKADGYMPSTGQFVLQNTYTVGQYPRFDPFAAMYIKRTRLFFKFENAFQGFPKDGYFTTALYPMPDRVWRFGLSWDFFD